MNQILNVMKTSRLLFGLVLVSFMAFGPLTATAHKGHTNGHRHVTYMPYWVPNHLAGAEVRHVYFPEFDVYFDRWNGTFIYFSGNRWRTSVRRPFGIRPVDFARTYKVGLAIDSPRPYVYHTRNKGRRYYRSLSQNYRYGYRYSYGHQNPSNREYYRDQDYRNERSRDEYNPDDRSSGNNGRRGRGR